MGYVTVNEYAVLKEVCKFYHVCPTFNGGRNWPSSTYNPKTNVHFVTLINLFIDLRARADRDAAPQFVYNVDSNAKFASGRDKVGRIDAISVETGKTLFTYESRASNYTPILTTAGGLLFPGTMARSFPPLASHTR